MLPVFANQNSPKHSDQKSILYNWLLPVFIVKILLSLATQRDDTTLIVLDKSIEEMHDLLRGSLDLAVSLLMAYSTLLHQLIDPTGHDTQLTLDKLTLVLIKHV